MLILYFFFKINLVFATVEEIENVGNWLRQDKVKKAISILANRLNDKSISPKNKDIYRFIFSFIYYNEKNFEQALSNLEQLPNNTKFLFYDFKHYLMSEIYLKRKEFDKSLKHVKKISRKRIQRMIYYESRRVKAEIYIATKKWKAAYIHLRYLSRKRKRSNIYPWIIWNIAKVQKKRGRNSSYCSWIRHLYSKQAAKEIVAHWGADLYNNKFEGYKTTCKANFSRIRTRIKHLIWSGQSNRALKEIKSITHLKKYKKDQLTIKYLMSEGKFKEAMKIFIPYNRKKRNNQYYAYQLASLSSKAEKPSIASGIYYHAHKLRVRSRKGKKALFLSGFTNYQFKFYDNAIAKFKEFNKKYPRSKLTRRSSWLIAWINYLKGNYKESAKLFEKLLNKKNMRSKRSKIRYWLAMSYLRDLKINKARKNFDKLFHNSLHNFYSILARQRIKYIEQNSSIDKWSRSPASIFLKSFIQGIKTLATAENNNSEELKEEAVISDIFDEEEEENISLLNEEADKDKKLKKKTTKVVKIIDPSKIDPLHLDDDNEIEKYENQLEAIFQKKAKEGSILSSSFKRSQYLIAAGFDYWARWELYTIEKLTRNKNDLMALMRAYSKINAFNRVSYISGIYFIDKRSKYGIRGTEPLWKKSFPQAYIKHVDKYSKKFNVDKFFILSIMRAESRFSKDVVSPVGAIGLMQIIPKTGKQLSYLLGDRFFSPDLLFKYEHNIRYGTRYLSRLLNQFDNKLLLAIASYNAGPHRVKNWLNELHILDYDEFIDHVPFAETRNYLKKVIRNYYVYHLLYSKKSPNLTWLTTKIDIKFKKYPFFKESW